MGSAKVRYYLVLASYPVPTAKSNRTVAKHPLHHPSPTTHWLPLPLCNSPVYKIKMVSTYEGL